MSGAWFLASRRFSVHILPCSMLRWRFLSFCYDFTVKKLWIVRRGSVRFIIALQSYIIDTFKNLFTVSVWKLVLINDSGNKQTKIFSLCFVMIWEQSTPKYFSFVFYDRWFPKNEKCVLKVRLLLWIDHATVHAFVFAALCYCLGWSILPVINFTEAFGRQRYLHCSTAYLALQLCEKVATLIA